MSEKELLYIEDTLGHLTNCNEYLENYKDGVYEKNYNQVLNDYEKLNKEIYKKFLKLISE